MKRDLNLVRRLLQILDDPQQAFTDRMLDVSVWKPHVQYHLRMLVEADLARGYGYALNGAVSLRLTWRGHELMELSKDETIWRRAVTAVQQKTGGMSLTAVESLLRQWHAERTEQAETWLPQGIPAKAWSRTAWQPAVVERPRPAKPEPAEEPVLVASRPLPSRAGTVGFQLDVLRGQAEDALPVYML